MDSMIHVGPKMDKETADNLSKAICAVMDSIRKNNIDREVSIKALDILSTACNSQANGLTFNNNTLISGKEHEQSTKNVS